MSTLQKRITAVEQQRPDIAALSDDELREYASTLPSGSSDQVGAVVALVCRRGSTLPIVLRDPEKQRVTVSAGGGK